MGPFLPKLSCLLPVPPPGACSRLLPNSITELPSTSYGTPGWPAIGNDAVLEFPPSLELPASQPCRGVGGLIDRLKGILLVE